MLTPAILTETIEIKTVERSVFLKDRKLEDAMLKSLTERFIESASALLNAPEIRKQAMESLQDIVLQFSKQASVPVANVDVVLGIPES